MIFSITELGAIINKSLVKALDILDQFNPEKPSLSLSEISQNTGFPKSTVHSILSTFLLKGYVEQIENGRYALGKKIIILTRSVMVNTDIRDRAAPYLRKLAGNCGQSVYLTCRYQGKLLYIYAIESESRLLARTAVGDLVPLHCTANGKSIAAFLPECERKELFDQSPLPAFTPYTITSYGDLEKELCEVRQKGFALDRQEHELGTYCLGTPIFGSDSKIIGACSISGQDEEIIKSKMEEFSTLLITTAQEISWRMGYVPSHPSMIATVSAKGFSNRE